MAALILSNIGAGLFGPVGGFVGALAGARLDAIAGAALAPARVQPSRLAGLTVQAAQEGAEIPVVHGRARLTGQVIWAARFKEGSTSRRVGGKTGQRVVERHYTVSFAVGLCEGPVSGLGQVWANGDPLDLSALAWRLHPGSESQDPDPLIEAVEGLGQAPAHRGLAYVVFEDFPLDGFGDRIPQLSFEVHTRDPASVASLESLARGINLIPACGEFAYAVTPVRNVIRPGREAAANLTVSPVRTDLMVALDQLQRDLPRVDSVALAVAWFGDDLRCGVCTVMPRCETATRQTRPLNWLVAGLDRASAPKVSLLDGRPALGGTPTDRSVIEAIAELKRRGFKVTLNPFLMLDIPPGNTLPRPDGGTGQPAYAWRGRITCHPAPGRPGSPDRSAAADSQVASFFGTAQRTQMAVTGGTVLWAPGSGWGYRRFVLHLAGLAAAAGGIDTLLLGSELRDLTRVRGADGSFPAVEALRALAADVRAILGPGTTLSYGADWTEYGGQVPADDPAGLMFPLDSLWADPLVGCVGLDWYPPLADERPGDPRPDIAALQAGLAGGEAFDWFYASDADREAGTRTPITDGAHGEPWVYRQKDIRSWWSHAHHPRTGGVRSATPTAWVPGMKPVRLLELGFAAVDRAANRPSAFGDPKSAEHALPPFSTGARDDAAQRLALEASLGWWLKPGINPVSPLTGAPMLETDRTQLWCWDARPYPHFPVRTDLWSDGPNAATGHWLAGRAGMVSLGAVMAAIARRAGVAVDASGVDGTLEGHVLAGTTARDALATLAGAFGLEIRADPAGIIRINSPGGAASHLALADADLVADGAAAPRAETREMAAGPREVRVSHYASRKALLPALATARLPGGSGPVQALAVPVVCDDGLATRIARRVLAAGEPVEAQVRLAPLAALRLETGDRLVLPGSDRLWRLERTSGAITPRATCVPAPPPAIAPLAGALPAEASPAVIGAAPVLRVLDLPAPWCDPAAPRPLLAAAAEPWGGDVTVRADAAVAAILTRPARIGELATALPPAPAGVRLALRPELVLAFGALETTPACAALLDGAGSVLDVIGWESAVLAGPSRWRLGGVVRGLGGAAPAPALAAGCELVLLDGALVPAVLPPGRSGTLIRWTALPAAATDAADGTTLDCPWQARGALPWSPVHLSAHRTPQGVLIGWVRRARGDGDAWEPADVPPAAATPAFRIRIRSPAGAVLRTLEAPSSPALYPAADEIADFGAPGAILAVSIAQRADDGREGPEARAELAVR